MAIDPAVQVRIDVHDIGDFLDTHFGAIAQVEAVKLKQQIARQQSFAVDEDIQR